MFSLITNSNVCIILILFNITLLVVIHRLLQKINQTKHKQNDISDYVTNLISTIDKIRYGNLVARVKKHPNKNLNNLSQCINRMIETLNDREKMIIEYQQELKHSNDLNLAVINTLSNGILVLDENYKIIQATNKIYKWFGEKKKIINKDILKFITVSNEKEIKNLDDDEIFIEENTSKSFTCSVRKIDSTSHLTNYLMVIKDVTIQKEIETLKEDFVATLTHDLKVPIIAESNMLNFLLSDKFGSLNEKQAEAIRNMQSSNKELLELVHVVLDTYKLREEGIKLFKESVDISEFIEEIISEMQPIADISKHQFISKLINGLQLNADKIQLKRVLKNIIQNAISYGQSESDIEIKLKQEKENIIIFIKNYGKGISKEDIDKIFNKYYSASKKFRKIGTGLGLYLSKEIILAHNGNITVTSEEGKSTTFIITIPKG